MLPYTKHHKQIKYTPLAKDTPQQDRSRLPVWMLFNVGMYVLWFISEVLPKLYCWSKECFEATTLPIATVGGRRGVGPLIQSKEQQPKESTNSTMNFLHASPPNPLLHAVHAYSLANTHFKTLCCWSKVVFWSNHITTCKHTLQTLATFDQQHSSAGA